MNKTQLAEKRYRDKQVKDDYNFSSNQLQKTTKLQKKKS